MEIRRRRDICLDFMKGMMSDHPFAKHFKKICMNNYNKTTEWINKLIAEGYKAAHPDDGWVDRERNEVYLCYPHFDIGVDVGDKIVLGCSEKYRVVKITGKRKNTFSTKENPMIHWKFEEVK